MYFPTMEQILQTRDVRNDTVPNVCIMQARADEPMARVSKVASEKIFLAREIHCCPNIFPISLALL
jgi:hypothetical protein